MMIMRHAGLLVCAICVLLLGLPCCAADPAPFEKETVYTDTFGTIKQFYRAAATAADLGMPLWTEGTLLQQGVYRLRNRKDRDILRYAFIRFTTAKPAEEIAAFYLAALGPEARRDTDKATGDVTVYCGEPADFRLVTITREPDATRLTLEHVERFPSPPRAYTGREQQVVRVVEEVTRGYHQARRVAYTMEQRIETAPAAGEPAPVLLWQFDFRRPKTLAVTVSAEDTVGLEIATQGDRLILTRPGTKPEERGLGDTITAGTVPEVQSDPIARLMLGDTLLSDEIDYLGLQAVGDLPLAQQVEVILTFPEDLAVLRLTIDRQRGVILRAETVITQEDRVVRVIRTYTNTVLEPAPVAAAPVTPTKPPAPTRAVPTP
ncbi:MAG: hypothetical protein ACYDCO_18720 [Armatimonadota bacterium]